MVTRNQEVGEIGIELFAQVITIRVLIQQLTYT